MKTWREVFGAAALAASVAMLPDGGAHAAPTFRIVDIGDLAGFGSTALGINESGWVTGNASVSVNTTNAFLSVNQVMTDLGTPSPFVRSQGADINDFGTVVGTALSITGDFARAVVFSGGSTTILGTLGGVSSYGYAINNAGQVTGSAQTVGNANRHAFRFTDGVMIDLGSLHGHTSEGVDINDAGQVVGVYFVGGGNSFGGFLYDGSSTLDLSSLGMAMALGINNAGQVAGLGTDLHAALYEHGVVRSLGSLGGSLSNANDITDLGWIIGASMLPGDKEIHAFLVTDGQMMDLNALLEPVSGDGWVLTSASAANEAGQIVGQGTYRNQVRSFLLTPIPEPASPMLLAAALLAATCASRRWRRRA